LTTQTGGFRVSIIWWIFTIIFGLAGTIAAIGGAIYESATHNVSGIIFMVVAPFSLAVSGIFATLASKYQLEEKLEKR
jgi:drug/metabolite transporter (DMT)-like permease